MGVGGRAGIGGYGGSRVSARSGKEKRGERRHACEHEPIWRYPIKMLPLCDPTCRRHLPNLSFSFSLLVSACVASYSTDLVNWKIYPLARKRLLPISTTSGESANAKHTLCSTVLRIFIEKLQIEERRELSYLFAILCTVVYDIISRNDIYV